MKYKVGDRFRYKDLYETFEIIRCDEELGQYVTVEVKEVGSRIFNEWEEKNMALEVLVDSSTKKLKLIDVLNKIANGELKEGTKFSYQDREGVYEDNEDCIYFRLKDLNEKCELIEPDHFADVGKMAEPTDNTTEKIEELNIDFANEIITCNHFQILATNKLNEVIRYINKENNNE